MISRNKNLFIDNFKAIMETKYLPSSLKVNDWLAYSEFAKRTCYLTPLDQYYFYKQGSALIKEIIKGYTDGYLPEDYNLAVRETLVISIGPHVQFEVQKNHNDKFVCRIIKS